MRLNIKAPRGEKRPPAAVRRFKFVKHLHLFCTRPSRMLLAPRLEPPGVFAQEDCQHNQNKPSPRKHSTFQIGATLRCTTQIQTSCLELHRLSGQSEGALLPKRLECAVNVKARLKVTLMEMQPITAPWRRQRESVAGTVGRTRCGA